MSRARLPLRPRARVVVDNDWSGDPDGLVALAHHLLSPANRVEAVTSTPLDPRFPVPRPLAADGAALAQELLDVLGGDSRPPVAAGREGTFDPSRPESSAAAEAIVTAARRADPLPLYVVCGGPLTNVADALRRAPDVAVRTTLVWIGGALEEGRFEYNREADPEAARYVLATEELAVHQFPVEAYRQCAYSVAELEEDLAGSGALGEWLWSHFLDPPAWVDVEGVWPLGDSPPVLVTALSVESSRATVAVPAAPGRGERRVYTDVDTRLLFGDMLARLRQHGRTPRSTAG